MDNPSRLRYVSVTFLAGFGVGAFAGVALAIFALFLVQSSDADTAEEPAPLVVAPTPSPTRPPGTPTPTGPRARTLSAQDVRLGPGTAFAIVGTLAKGDAVEAVGRDASSQWVAIRFPPNSQGRGWLPVSELEQFTGLEQLAVTLPTPLPRSVTVPTLTSRSSDDGIVPATTTPGGESVDRPAATQTAVVNLGPPDLAVTGLTRLSDGRVRVVVTNRGPSALVGQAVFVLVRDVALSTEVLVSAQRGLEVGQTLTFETQHYVVTQQTNVTAIVDPYTSLLDRDRSNNSLTVSLAAPSAVTASPTPAN